MTSTVVDFDALELSEGPKVIILGNTQIGLSGTGDSFSDFSGFSGVHVVGEARLQHAGRGQPSLTITVEHSDDGNSWSTATTFSYGPDGKRSARVDSPKAFWRVSWAPAAGSVWQIVAVTVAPVYFDQTGGGSFPPEDWSVAANGDLTITPTGAGGLGLQAQPLTATQPGGTTTIATIGAGETVDPSAPFTGPDGTPFTGNLGLAGIVSWGGGSGIPLAVVDGQPATPTNIFFAVDTNGQCLMAAQGNGDVILTLYDLQNSVKSAEFTIGNGITLYDASGNPAFQVQYDGSVHIQTGKSIVADL